MNITNLFTRCSIALTGNTPDQLQSFIVDKMKPLNPTFHFAYLNVDPIHTHRLRDCVLSPAITQSTQEIVLTADNSLYDSYRKALKDGLKALYPL